MAETVLYALRSGEQVSSVLGTFAAESALGAVLSLLPGGVVAGAALGLESDETPAVRAARKRNLVIDGIVGSIPNFDSMSAADQLNARNEIARLLDEPLIVEMPVTSNPAPRQLLPA